MTKEKQNKTLLYRKIGVIFFPVSNNVNELLLEIELTKIVVDPH